jgi:multidrug efflux pump subunit AcrA (membrane-fusion protein)
MKKRTKTGIIIGLVVALVALILVPNILKGGPKPGGAPGGAPPAASAAPGAKGPAATSTVYSVKTQVLANGSLRDYLELTGDVVTETNVDVFADTGGRLAVIHVQVGDTMVKGKTVIAEVDPSKPGASYAMSPVYSPISGTLTSLTGELGATVTTSTSIGTVGILSDLLVDAQVPETQIAQVKNGLKADITFEAFPGKVFAAQVKRVDPVIDTASRSKKIRLAFVNGAGPVNLGMFAKVKLYFDARQPEVLAPLESVVTRVGKSFVFVVSGDSVQKREVTTGISVDGTVELLTGVKTGETLVIKGQELLDEGVKVKVVS